MHEIEKKKSFIINTVYVAIVLALFYLFFKYVFGTIFTILLAMLVAMLLQKPVRFICSKTPIKKGFVSAMLVLVSFFAVIGILALIIAWIGSEFKGFFQYIMLQFEDIPTLIEKIEGYAANLLSFLPEKLESSATDFISDKLNGLLNTSPDAPKESFSFDFSMFAGPLSGLWNTAKQIPTTFVSIIVGVIACCFMTADYDGLKNLILGLFRTETRTKVVRAKRLLFPAMGKMIKAYGLIMTITFTEVALGLFILKLLGAYNSGYIFVIAILTAIIDIIPVLGTGTVLLPWAVYNLIVGNYSLAIGLFVMYICITVIRQVMEPKLVADQLGIPAFLTIVCMFIGSQIFGFLGIFILPLTVVMLKLLNDEGIIHIIHKPKESKVDSP